MKKEKDSALADLNKGIEYLREKAMKMKNEIQPTRFDSEKEEKEWDTKVKELLHGCEEMQVPEDAELLELEEFEQQQ
jgi:hypothetical protein